jgi:hypothetical protein
MAPVYMKDGITKHWCYRLHIAFCFTEITGGFIWEQIGHNVKLLCIREVSGSNFGPETGYPE